MTGSGTLLDPYIITTPTDLQNVDNDLTAYYELGNDIDLVGVDFSPIGELAGYTIFTGSFDGKGYSISNITKTGAIPNDFGLFYEINGTIANINITNITITVDDAAGFLNLGGLAEFMSGGSVTHCSVQGQFNIAGQAAMVGGLIGNIYGISSVSECWTDVEINYTRVPAARKWMQAGGLVSWVDIDNILISNCYALGDINTTRTTYERGGLIAINGSTSAIQNCYSTGYVTPTGSSYGGFIGENYYGTETVTGCYWDTETSGTSTDTSGATGKTTTEMKTQSTFIGWDFTTVWAINPTINDGYPYLGWESIVTVITTIAASNIHYSTAQLNGESTGTDLVYFEYGKVSGALDLTTSSQSGATTFHAHVTGLDGDTVYYFRAVGLLGASTFYGSELSFTTLEPSIDTLACHYVSFYGAQPLGQLNEGKGYVGFEYWSDPNWKHLVWKIELYNTVVGTIDKSGTATATTANHLVDTTLNQFGQDVNKKVFNTTDSIFATVTAFNSTSDVTLSEDIMANGEGYELYLPTIYGIDLQGLEPETTFSYRAVFEDYVTETLYYGATMTFTTLVEKIFGENEGYEYKSAKQACKKICDLALGRMYVDGAGVLQYEDRNRRTA